MTGILKKFVEVREGEGKRLLIMASHIFVIIAAYNVLKPMTRSLFVSNLGLDQLPVLYIILATVMGFFVSFYLRVSDKLRLNKLINSSTLFLIVCLLAFWWLIQLNIKSPILYYSLFIWASIFGVLTTTQFWLLANHVFNAREAKRLFPVLTSSALTGAIMGGYFTKFLVKTIGGTANLAFFCIAMLVMAMMLTNLGWRNRDKSLDKSNKVLRNEKTHPERALGQTFSLIKNSKHLALLVVIVWLTYIVVQIADFQFVAYASQNISNTDDLTGFLGFWLSNLSIFALVFQMLFANTILQRFGVGVIIMFLPLSLLITSLWVLLSYGLISVLALTIGDGAFRHSINKVGMELLYLPIPPEVKKRTKAFIDMFVDRFARGIAGGLLLIFYTWLGLSIAQISLLSISLISFWIALSIVTYREYINSFRSALNTRRIDSNAILASIRDEATINSLIVSLASKNDRQVIYALQVLQSVESVDLEPALEPLLQHKSVQVRRNTISLLHKRKARSLIAKVEPLLKDPDETVRHEAVKFYTEFCGKSLENLITGWLDSDDIILKGAAINFLAVQGELAKKILSPKIIESYLSFGTEGKSQVARAIGILKDETYYPYLKQLLCDEDITVRRNAIRSSGLTQAEEFVPILLESLQQKTCRRAAREALALYGDKIIDELIKCLHDQDMAMELRRSISRVFGLMGSQRSVETLLNNLYKVDEYLKYEMIKSLNKLRERNPNLDFDKRVDKAIQDELHSYFRILATYYVSDKQNGKSDKNGLLSRALQERLDDHLERIFRLLGLTYPPKDIYNAFAAANSSNVAIRANAIEFLDNILSKQHKRLLLPVVEDMPVEQVLKRADGYLDIHITSREDAIRDLVTKSNDSWLQTCALYEIGVSGLVHKFKPEIEQASQARHWLIKETANMIMKKFA